MGGLLDFNKRKKKNMHTAMIFQLDCKIYIEQLVENWKRFSMIRKDYATVVGI